MTSAERAAIGVGVAGFWHVHANDYARAAAEHPATRVVAGWDPDPQLLAEGTEPSGVAPEPSLESLLARDDVDAVTVTTATTDHVAVIGRAIDAGKHVFSEKLLAGTVQECERLVAAAERAGVALVVSLPRLAEPTTVAVREAIGGGDLGEITYVRVRMAHDGWLGGWLPDRFADERAAIGGAFTDLGCHPAYLVQQFLGTAPETVTATYGRVTGRTVEDHAVVTSRYPDGAIGVAEASFVTRPGAFALEVRGTEATMLFGFGREELTAKGGRFGEAWSAVSTGDGEPSPFEAWVDAIRTGADVSANQRAAVELTRLVSAANDSARTGTVVRYAA